MRFFQALSLFLSLLLTACGSSETPQTQEGIKHTGFPAIDALSEEIQAKPQDAELYFARAKAHADNDFMPEAVQDAEKALSLDSTKIKYYQILADAYFDNNQSRQAIKILERATANFPQDAPLWLDLAEVQLYVESYDDALASVDQYLKLKPMEDKGLFVKGQVYKYSGDTTRAMEFFQQAVEQNSNNLEAYIQLADLSELMNQGIALKYLDNALRIDSSHYDALFLRAQYFHMRARWDEAIAAYEKLIVAHPLQADPHYNFGLLYMERKDYAKAREAFDKALKFNVQFERAYYYRGEAAEKLGDKEAALKDYEQALRFQPNLKLALDGVARLKKG